MMMMSDIAIELRQQETCVLMRNCMTFLIEIRNSSGAKKQDKNTKDKTNENINIKYNPSSLSLSMKFIHWIRKMTCHKKNDDKSV